MKKLLALFLLLSFHVSGQTITVVRDSVDKKYQLSYRYPSPTIQSRAQALKDVASWVNLRFVRKDTLANFATTSAIANLVPVSELANYATINDLNYKVDKVTGKVLSSNDYTNADKAKVNVLSGVNTGDQLLKTINGESIQGTGNITISSGGGGGVSLGTTSSTAFRGDYGQAAYAHISNNSNPHLVTAAQLGLPSSFKTINGQAITGTGDLTISGGGSGVELGSTSSTAFRGDYGQAAYNNIATTATKASKDTLSNFVGKATTETISGAKTFSAGISMNNLTVTGSFSNAGLTTLLAGKVNVDGSKVLSDNNFTSALLSKLNGLPSSLKTINGQSLSGTGDITISGGGVSLGTTNTTAFRGDYGQAAYDNIAASAAALDARIPYVTVEQFGTVSASDAAANTTLFALATATGKTIMLGKRVYKGDWVLNKQRLVGQGFSSGWGSGNEAATIIQGSVTLNNQSSAENLNVENSTTHGFLVRGFSVLLKNVAAHNNAGNGFDLTGTGSHNLNHWRLEGIASTYNTGAGVLIDNATADPNANAGTALNLDIRNNNNGLIVDRAIDNSFYGVTAEENSGIGIWLKSRAKGNRFYTPYTEVNATQEIQMDSGSDNNMIDGYRSGSNNEAVTDNGSNNTVVGKVYNVPRTRLLTVGQLQFMDYDEGRFNITKSNQNLIINTTNTSLNGKVLFQHPLGGYRTGIGFKTGGNHAVATGFAAKDAYLDFGTVAAQSTTTVDVAMSEVDSYTWTATVQPHSAVLPSGIIMQAVYKSSGYVSVRVTNTTSSGINVAAMSVWINAIQLQF